MSFTHTAGKSLVAGGSTVSGTKTYTGVSQVSLSTTVPIQSNYEIDVGFPYAKVVSFALLCDQIVTFKTNSSGSPDNTLTLVAGDVYVWNTDSQSTFKITADVTKLYVTNASAAVANLSMQVLSSA